MPAKVDTSVASSPYAVTGMEDATTATTKTGTNQETDLERGDQPHRHRWEGFLNDDNPDEAMESIVIVDVFRYTCCVLFVAAIIIWAAGVISLIFFGFIAGAIFVVNVVLLSRGGATYKAIRSDVISAEEFFEKMDAMYAADAQLCWTIQCYHNEKTYYTMWETNLDTGSKTPKGGGRTKKRVNTHKASMVLDYYKCSDRSVHVSPSNIKEGNLYRFLVEKHVKRGDDQIVKAEFKARHKNRDKHYNISEDLTIPTYEQTFLVSRDLKSRPFLLSPLWYAVCSLTVVLTIPYDIYFCCKTKSFPIEVVKEFWVYPENHQSQNSSQQEIGSSEEDLCNGNVVPVPPPETDNAGADNNATTTNNGDGQTSDGFNDEEIRMAIAMSLQENGK